ncbi:hypothetical protein SteCoe_30574 [Stentor coeruleus]|uniref:Ricin B lectin domain-containing protein n=1 Tax=Stentor coeruleus TaxID=5963 RepID=A0A1R2B3C5_9CILI|nr:hypothetical protein SteCoe_30574 [Stentor coeruleus]
MSGNNSQEVKNVDKFDFHIPQEVLANIVQQGIDKIKAIETSLWEFIDRRFVTINEFYGHIREINIITENSRKAQIGGSSASVAGGLITVGTLTVSLFTGGLSLIGLALGGVIGTGGAVNNIIDTNSTNDRVNWIINKAKENLNQDTMIKEKLINTIKDFGSWLESVKERNELNHLSQENKSQVVFLILNSISTGFKLTGRIINIQNIAKNLLSKILSIGSGSIKGASVGFKAGSSIGKIANLTSKSLNILAVVGLGFSIYELTTNIISLLNNEGNEMSFQLQEAIHALHTELTIICEKVDDVTNGAVFARICKIIDQDSGKCLEIIGNYVAMHEDCGNYTQLWIATNNGHIINYQTRQALSVTANWAIVIEPKNNSKFQKWRIRYKRIQNVEIGAFLFTSGNANPTVASQGSIWTISEIHDYTIRTELNYFCLDIKNANRNPRAIIQTYPSNGSKAQKWIMNNSFIESMLQNVLDVEGSSHEEGTRVIAWPLHGGKNQKWIYNEETRYIESELNGMVLDVKWGNKNSSTPCHIYRKNGTLAQKWIYTVPKEKSWSIKDDEEVE